MIAERGADLIRFGSYQEYHQHLNKPNFNNNELSQQKEQILLKRDSSNHHNYYNYYNYDHQPQLRLQQQAKNESFLEEEETFSGLPQDGTIEFLVDDSLVEPNLQQILEMNNNNQVKTENTLMTMIKMMS